MDIRKRKLKGYVALSILIIACLIMASAMTFFVPKNNAEAIINMASTMDIGDLMLSESKNGKIFDGDVLQKLYGLVTGNKNATFDDVKNAGKKDSEFFRNTSLNSDKKDLIIKIGQFKWNIVYLSHTSDDENADVILTLLLTDSTQLPSAYQTAQFNTFAPSNTATTHTKYPANMYGTSMIRAVTLNNGGKYATSTSALTADEAEQDLDNPFAQYTMDTATSSLTDYIVTPGEVQWQRSEQANVANDFKYNLNNDAIDSISSGFANHNYQITPGASIVSQEQRTADYTAWKDDKIWLPSLAEIGTGYTGNNNGIWNTNANQRGSSATWSWLRSAAQTTSTRSVVVMQKVGMCVDNNSTGNTGTNNLLANDSYAVRPAFHLNLTKVAEKATVTSTERTGDTTQYKSYNDVKDFTFELDKINREVVNKVELTATNLDSDDKSKMGTPTTTEITPTYASGGMSFKVKDVGKYTVKITLKDGQYWKDGSTTKTFDFYLKYKLTALAWNKNSSPEITETYNGEEQYLV
ncbi:MAG: hypothetical protein K2J13_05355, partial [Clostridia bacterium]|nr:hypothetical protein [Clostridia bacterium]